MSQWTKEPWEVSKSHSGRFGIYGKGEKRAVCGSLRYESIDKANLDRIVACVNACAGLSNPAETLRQLRLRDAECFNLTQQLNGLDPAAYRECLNTLSAMVDWFNHFRTDMTPDLAQKADECRIALTHALAHAQEEG